MKKIDLISILIFVFIIIPNIRPLIKYITYINSIFFIFYIIILFIFFYIVLKKQSYINLKKYISNYFYISFILLIATLIIWYLYPIADALKLQMKGSDKDDGIILAATAILNLEHPYLEPSYYGNPHSAGMGIILIYLPFVYLNLYQFGAIYFSAYAILKIHKFANNSYYAAVFSTLLFSSIFNIETLIQGTDLFLVGCGLVILSIDLMKNIGSKNILKFLWPAVLCGLLASSRINFLIIVPIISLYIFIYSKKISIIFGVLATIVALLPSIFVYFLDPQSFTPLHLIVKGNYLLEGNLKILAIISSILAYLIGFYIVKNSFINISLALFLSLAPALILLAIGDIKLRIARGEELLKVLANLDGFNYFTPLLPLAVFIFITRVLKKN
jgi:hypothetical protein